MKYKELHDFVQRILAVTYRDPTRTSLVLGELIHILEEQGTSKQHVDMVKSIQNSLPEAYELSETFSKEDVIIIERRAAERKRREEEAARSGRC